MQNYVKISREEYAQLKKLQKYFEAFWGYLTHLHDIREARRDVRDGRIMPQEKLFKKLGL